MYFLSGTKSFNLFPYHSSLKYKHKNTNHNYVFIVAVYSLILCLSVICICVILHFVTFWMCHFDFASFSRFILRLIKSEWSLIHVKSLTLRFWREMTVKQPKAEQVIYESDFISEDFFLESKYHTDLKIRAVNNNSRISTRLLFRNMSEWCVQSLKLN